MEKDKWLRPIDGIGSDISVSALTTASKSIRGLKPGAMEGVYDWHKRFPRKADGTPAEPRDATSLALRPRAETSAGASTRRPLTVPITLLRTAGSERTNDDIVALVEGVNKILAQADVSIEVIEFLEWKQTVVAEPVNGVFSCPLAEKIGHRGGLLQIAFVPTIDKYVSIKFDCDRCGFIKDRSNVDSAHLMAQLIAKMLGVPQAPLHAPTHLTSHDFKGRVLTPVDSQILRWHAARAAEIEPDWQPPQLNIPLWIYRVTAPTYAATASAAELQEALEAAASIWAPSGIRFHVHATCDLAPHELDDATCAEIVGAAHAGEAFPKLQALTAHAPRALHVFSLGRRKTWAISGSAQHPVMVMAAFALTSHRAIAMNLATALGLGRLPYRDSLTAVKENGTYLSPPQIERARAATQDRFGQAAAGAHRAVQAPVTPSVSSAGIVRPLAPRPAAAAPVSVTPLDDASGRDLPRLISAPTPSPSVSSFGAAAASSPISCGAAPSANFASATAQGEKDGAAGASPALLRVPLTVHLVENANYGTRRDEAAALALIDKVNEVWREVGVRFDARVLRTSAPDFVLESACPRVIDAAAPAPRATADLLRTLSTFDSRALNVFLLEKIIMRSAENKTSTISALAGDYSFLLSDASGEKLASIALLYITTILRADPKLPSERLLGSAPAGLQWTSREKRIARGAMHFFTAFFLTGDRGYDLVSKNGDAWEQYLHRQLAHLTRCDGEVSRYIAHILASGMRWRLVYTREAAPTTRLVTEDGSTFVVSSFTNRANLEAIDYAYDLMIELTRAAILASGGNAGAAPPRLPHEVCARHAALALLPRLGYPPAAVEKSARVGPMARFMSNVASDTWSGDAWGEFVGAAWEQACPGVTLSDTLDRETMEAIMP